jgi:superfamily II DNA or RNA helicase
VQIRLGPVWGSVIDPTLADVAWLSKTLSVQPPPIERAALRNIRSAWARRAIQGPVPFYRYAERRFPSGLASFLAQAAEEDGREIEWTWEPEATTQALDPEWEAALPEGLAVRDYQREIVVEAVRAGRGVIRAATSSGKTAVMAMILRALGLPPALVLVGGRSLVAQTRLEIARWLGEEVGEISSGRRVVSPRVVVGLVQSVAAHAHEPWLAEFLTSRRVLMVDEVHHVARGARGAGSGARIRGGQWYSLAMACPAPNRYGLSATPLKLGDPVQNWRLVGSTGPLLTAGISGTDLVEQGYAARPHVYFLSYDTPSLPRMPYPAAVRLGIVSCPARNEVCAYAARELHALGLKVLVLVERSEHGRALLEAVQGLSVPAAYTHGGLSQADQEERLDWLRRPGARVLISTRVLGEGANVPDLGGVIYARGGKGFVQLFQGIGRGIRPKGAPGEAGACVVVIPDDAHHPRLAKHVDLLKAFLRTEPGYSVGGGRAEGLRAFSEAALGKE